jgi:hypothetical protein
MPEKTLDEILQHLIDNCETDDWKSNFSEFKLIIVKGDGSIIEIKPGILAGWNLHLFIDHILITTLPFDGSRYPNKLAELYKKINDKFLKVQEDTNEQVLQNLCKNLF